MADNVTLLLCAHYQAEPGEVFVEIDDEECGKWWESRPLTDVGDAPIITCSRCPKPAVQLDHLWPYQSEMCLCAEHLVEQREEERQQKDDLRHKIDHLYEMEAALAVKDARIKELEAELVALKARTCETCKHYDGAERLSLCWAHDSFVDPADFCSHHEAKEAPDAH